MNSQAPPVLVLIKASNCPACATVSRLWPDCVRQMKQVVPNLVEVVIQKQDIKEPIDTGVYPGILSVFTWFPSTLLVPGRVWQEEMSRVGTGSINALPGAHIFNGEWVTDTSVRQTARGFEKYKLTRPDDYKRWIQSAIESEDFRRASVASAPLAQPVLRTKPTSPHPPGGEYVASSSAVTTCGLRLIPREAYHSR